MTLDASTHIPPGWYPDPQGSFQQRWWDGSAWTNEFAQYRPILNYSGQAKPAAASEHIPTFALPATDGPLSPPAPRAELLGTAPVTPPQPTSAPVASPPAYTPPTALQPPLVSVQPIMVGPVDPVPSRPGSNENQFPRSGVMNSGITPPMPTLVSSPGGSTPGPESRFVGVDGSNGAGSVPYEPFAQAPRPSASAPRERSQRVYTAAAWALAVIPLAAVVTAYVIAAYGPLFYSAFAVLIIGIVLAGLMIGIGYADSTRLHRLGHERTTPGILALFGPLFFIARMFPVRRETGRSGVALLVVSLAVWGGAIAAYFLVPGASETLGSVRL